MSRQILVTLAGTLQPRSRSWERRQGNLCASARRHGFDATVPWTRARLMETSFYAAHRDVLDRERGAGYWAWKPYIIHRTLEEADEGDHVVYWDVGGAPDGDEGSGNLFRRSIRPLIRWCDKRGGGALPGTLLPQHGPNRRWTKRDGFVFMGCDEPRYWETPQVEATFSIWRRDERSLAFLAEWLRLACDPRLVTDDANTCGLPNLPGFVRHRHDQSILTNLVVREGLRAPLSASGASKDMNRLADKLRWPAPFRRKRPVSWSAPATTSSGSAGPRRRVR